MRSGVRRSFTVVLAAGVVAGGALAAAWTASSSASTSGKPHLTERRILEIALKAAAGAGDPAPTLIQHSAGTRYRANLVDSGDVVVGSQWSYLIAERGHFILNGAPIPPGARAPKGTVLTLIVNARTGEVTDSGLSDRYPHLARLGPVHTDLRRKPAHHTTAQVGGGGAVYAVGHASLL
jgi:hypothetical protein